MTSEALCHCADSDGVHSIGILDARKTAASGRLVIDVMASSAANSAPDVMELFKLPTNIETSGKTQRLPRASLQCIIDTRA